MSEEVSEESSVTVTSAACGCHHQSGCAIGAIGGQLPVGDNGNSIEVRDRLKELQGRNSTLEQEKVRKLKLEKKKSGGYHVILNELLVCLLLRMSNGCSRGRSFLWAGDSAGTRIFCACVFVG